MQQLTFIPDDVRASGVLAELPNIGHPTDPKDRLFGRMQELSTGQFEALSQQSEWTPLCDEFRDYQVALQASPTQRSIMENQRNSRAGYQRAFEWLDRDRDVLTKPTEIEQYLRAPTKTE